MSPLERRYADALLRAAGDGGASGVYYKIKALSDLLEENAELRNFFLNPTISSAVKKKTLTEIISPETDDVTVRNFLFLLIDNKRIGILGGILKQLYKILPENREKLFIKIFTPAELSGDTIEKVGKKYRTLCGYSKSEAEIITDNSLLGGICVQIGDMRYDGTFKTKIKKLRERLN